MLKIIKKFFNDLKIISNSLSPNSEKDDILLALKLVFQPFKWKEGEEIKELEEKFKKIFNLKYAVSFNAGRVGFLAILKSLGIKENDEVLIQAFTCNAVVNPILYFKGKPVFVDIDETLNLDPEDLKRKITSKSKAIVVQHTFGAPAKINEIKKIAEENKLFLIEDCAHSFGVKYDNRLCGTFGDVSFFSFGRDKAISSVFGGMVISDNEKIAQKVKDFQETLDFPSSLWIIQQLLYSVIMKFIILPSYIFPFLGRITLGFFHFFRILSKSVSKKEKKLKIEKNFFKKFPNALAILALNQLKKIEKFSYHRKEIVQIYEENLKNCGLELPFSKVSKRAHPIFIRYPILFSGDTDKFLQAMRKKRIYLDDGWRKAIITPPDTDISGGKYTFNSCPKAEEIVKKIINLPTHINIYPADAQKIVLSLKTYGAKP